MLFLLSLQTDEGLIKDLLFSKLVFDQVRKNTTYIVNYNIYEFTISDR